METNKVPTMKIQVEFLLTHTSRVFEIANIPRVDEAVTMGLTDSTSFRVKDVIHIFGADVKKDVVAIVRIV